MNLKNQYTGLEIAVVGMSGRFPNANDLTEFWRNLVEEKEGISFFDKEELIAAGVSPDLIAMPNFVGAKGVFPNLEHFDADFFNYTERDAATLDPQVRALHQEVYHALEDAGYISEQFRDSIGLFIGSTSNFAWELETMKSTMDNDGHMYGTALLNDKDFAATRIAYSLNLQGPCVTVHSACSTSLYAVDLACRQILTGSCSLAVAGGSSLSVPSRNGYLYSDGMIHSPDGHCRPFDQDAKGTVEGNGVGVVVLKRLENAIKDRDHIYAVIRGSAVNNDGNRKVGFTAPSVEGQADVIRRALYMSDVPAQSISYIETHGTGTILGDPIEIAGLKKAFQSVNSSSSSIGIGSLKSNIGHLDVSAGIASLIKTSLALKNKVIPASINFETLNPNIDLENTPFQMVTKTQEWSRPLESNENNEYYPLRAGVSSFGIGGTNVHIVLEESPEREVSGPGREWKLLCLSAATEASLDKMKENYIRYIKDMDGNVNLSDMTYSVHTGHRNLKERFALPFRNVEDLIEGLGAGLSGNRSLKEFRNTAPESKPEVFFLFPGQGSQYVGMARDLYQTEQVFRDELEACLEIAEAMGKDELRQFILDPQPGDEVRIMDTENAQLSIFVVEYALGRLLMSWGIKPSGMIGHSLGEYTCACLAEVFTIEEGIRLVMARGRLMQAMPKGSMLSIGASATIIEHLLPETVSLASINSPNHCTVAGPDEDIEQLQAQLATMGLSNSKLKTSHAFHSHMMEGMLGEFGQIMASIGLREPKIPYVSNLTGDWIKPQDAVEASYYTRHIRDCVQFARGIETILANNKAIFIEVGPGRTLSTFVRQAAMGQGVSVVNTLRHPNEHVTDDAFLIERLGELWCYGVVPDWNAYYKGQVRNRVPLPQYPFEAKPFPIGNRDLYSLLKGIESGEKGYLDQQEGVQKHNVNVEEKVSQIVWEPSFLPSKNLTSEQRISLVLTHNVDHAIRLFKHLPNWRGIFVNIGEEYRFSGFYESEIRHANVTDMRRLFRDLKSRAMLPNTILLDQANVHHTEVELQVLTNVISEELNDAQPEIVVLSPITPVTDSPGLVALVRALGVESPELSLRLVDAGVLLGTDSVQKWASILEKELSADGHYAPVVSYKKGMRMVPQLRHLELGEVSDATAFSGNHLVVLSPENRLPVQVAQAFRGENTDTKVSILPYRLNPVSFKEETVAQALQDLQVHRKHFMDSSEIKDMSEVHHLVDEYASRLVYDYLYEVFPLETGDTFDIHSFKKGIGVIDSLIRYADYFLQMLCEDELVERVEDGTIFKVTEKIKSIREPKEIRADIESLTPLFSGQLELLEHCISKFNQALRGEIPALGVLYPEGKNELLQQTYEGSLQAKEEELAIEMFTQMLSTLSGEKRKIRILEAGGGFGTILRRVGKFLKGIEVEFYFTDISKSFLDDIIEYAREEELNFLKTGYFDITKDPEEQGLDSNYFDIVVAYNVVHATYRISESLNNLQGLLKPGALLCVIERIKTRRYVDLVWGLADGWWHFDGNEREHSPIVSLEEWKSQFEQMDLEHVTAYPDGSNIGQLVDVGIVVGRRGITGKAESTEKVLAQQEGFTCLPTVAEDDMDSLKNSLEAALQDLSNVDRVLLWDTVEDKNTRFNFINSTQREEASLAVELNRFMANCSATQDKAMIISTVHQMKQWNSDLTSWVVSNEELDNNSEVYRIYLFSQSEGNIQKLPAVFEAMIESGIRQVVVSPNESLLFSAKPTNKSKVSEETERTKLEQLEHLLSKIWTKILGREQIGIDEDFFALGGDSFKLIEMTTDLEDQGYKIVMNEVYKYPTIRLLAGYLNQQSKDHHLNITTIEQLEAHLTEQYGANYRFRAIDEEKSVNILFIDEAAVGGRETVRRHLQELRVSKDLLPHYILSLSLFEKLSEPIDLGELMKCGILTDSEKEIVERAEGLLNEGREIFDQGILSQPVINRFDLSNIQEVHFRGEVRLQLYMLRFDELVDEALLERALCDVVGSHQLLHSCLYAHNEGFRWKEFAPPLSLTLPRLDISMLTPDAQDRVMEEIAKIEWAADFKRLDKPMYHATLIKLNERSYNLFFQFDHSIFDISSGQAIRRHLLQRYKDLQNGVKHAMEAATSYEQYLQQIDKGPIGIDEEKLYKLFDLERYFKYTEIVTEKFSGLQEQRIQQMRYNIDLNLFDFEEDDSNAPFELALQVYALVIARLLEVDAVPFDLLFQNRRYEGKNFSDVVGLVLDAVPFIVSADRENPSHAADVIRNTVKNINKHNVNFVNLTKKMEVSEEVAASSTSTFYSPILLNYGGNAEEEYNKIWDYTMQQLDDEDQKKLNYAGIYGLVGVVKNELNFLILCKYEQDMERVRQAFDEEVAQLVKIYREKKELKVTGEQD